MKTLRTFCIFLCLVLATLCFAFDAPRYNPPETAKAEEAEFEKEGLVRGLNLGLLDELSGIRLNRDEKQIPLEIIPITPKHTGLTSVPQPILQWYISRDWSQGRIKFVLNELGSKRPDPIEVMSVGGPSEPGIYQINVAYMGVELEPGKKYEWYLSTEYQGRKLQTWAMIEYRKPSKELLAKLSTTPVQKHTFILAEAGFWYDCIAEAADMLNKNPQSEEFRVYRNALLAQVGLERLSDN